VEGDHEKFRHAYKKGWMLLIKGKDARQGILWDKARYEKFI
jgi:hypothetical protein